MKKPMSSVFSSWITMILSVVLAVLCLRLNWSMIISRNLALSWALPLVIVLVACGYCAWNAFKAIKHKKSIRSWISIRLVGVDLFSERTTAVTIGGITVYMPRWLVAMWNETGEVLIQLSKKGQTPPKGYVYDEEANDFITNADMEVRQQVMKQAEADREKQEAERVQMQMVEQVVQQMFLRYGMVPAQPAVHTQSEPTFTEQVAAAESETAPSET